MYAIGTDEASNELAGTKPRTWAAFRARWAEILADPEGTVTRVVPRVILVDGSFVGSINVFPQDDRDAIGYWIARSHWGRGIASTAVRLMLDEVRLRPLYATTAGHNIASMRVLLKHGFVAVTRCMTPETEQARARETVTFVLQA